MRRIIFGHLLLTFSKYLLGRQIVLFGARPSHAEWQGKVYSRSGTSKKYPSLEEATGYGTVTGLCGANCRHTMTPYVEGYSQLPNTDYSMQEKRFGMTSDEYYAATQKQRRLEREIRKVKRERAAIAVDGQETVKQDRRIRELQKKLREHVKENHLTRDYQREKVWGISEPIRGKGVSSVAVSKNAGALNDKNDPYGVRRDEHAERYYEELRKRGIKNVATRISSNTGYRRVDIETILSHVLIEKHYLIDEFDRFDADYDMSQSFQRLIEGSNIQQHDLTLLDHEMLEHVIMLDNGNIYSPAHEAAEKCYNYAKECDRWKTRKK